jgi:hypothetical protein
MRDPNDNFRKVDLKDATIRGLLAVVPGKGAIEALDATHGSADEYVRRASVRVR